jgi:hypothetical protein
MKTKCSKSKSFHKKIGTIKSLMLSISKYFHDLITQDIYLFIYFVINKFLLLKIIYLRYFDHYFGLFIYSLLL